MDEEIKLVMLYDVYGKLLTKRQQDIFEEYHLYNLSLREIADNKQISYQAVRDSIKTSEKMLLNFEEILKLSNLKLKVKEVIKLVNKNEDLNLQKEKIKTILEDEDDI